MQFKSHYFIRDAWDQFYACKTAMMEGPSINDFSECVMKWKNVKMSEEIWYSIYVLKIKNIKTPNLTSYTREKINTSEITQ